MEGKASIMLCSHLGQTPLMPPPSKRKAPSRNLRGCRSDNVMNGDTSKDEDFIVYMRAFRTQV